MLDRFAKIRRSVDFKAAAVAGVAGGAAYVVVMEIDNRLSGCNLDDLTLLGWFVVTDKSHAKLAGVPLHLANSISLATLYGATIARWAPGPGWFRGLVFAGIETVALFPTAALENHHPAIQQGKLDRFWNRKAFLLSIPRHAAYGLVLGGVYERLSTKT